MNNNGEMTYQQVLNVIQKNVDRFPYPTQKNAAAAWKVAESYLSEVLKGKKPPGKKILDANGIEHIDKYRYKRK